MTGKKINYFSLIEGILLIILGGLGIYSFISSAVGYNANWWYQFSAYIFLRSEFLFYIVAGIGFIVQKYIVGLVGIIGAAVLSIVNLVYYINIQGIRIFSLYPSFRLYAAFVLGMLFLLIAVILWINGRKMASKILGFIPIAILIALLVFELVSGNSFSLVFYSSSIDGYAIIITRYLVFIFAGLAVLKFPERYKKEEFTTFASAGSQAANGYPYGGTYAGYGYNNQTSDYHYGSQNLNSSYGGQYGGNAYTGGQYTAAGPARKDFTAIDNELEQQIKVYEELYTSGQITRTQFVEKVKELQGQQ